MAIFNCNIFNPNIFNTNYIPPSPMVVGGRKRRIRPIKPQLESEFWSLIKQYLELKLDRTKLIED